MQLEAIDVSFRYDKKSSWVLEHQNFKVERGECVGLFAPSGYGKSTLAKLLAGYLRFYWMGNRCPKKEFVRYN